MLFRYLFRGRCLETGLYATAINVKISSYLINYEHVLFHEDVWESEGIAPPFLTLAQDGGGWSASRPSRFTSWDTAPGNHWIGGFVGPRASLDAVE
jgi:hypothetical protein